MMKGPRHGSGKWSGYWWRSAVDSINRVRCNGHGSMMQWRWLHDVYSDIWRLRNGHSSWWQKSRHGICCIGLHGRSSIHSSYSLHSGISLRSVSSSRLKICGLSVSCSLERLLCLIPPSGEILVTGLAV